MSELDEHLRDPKLGDLAVVDFTGNGPEVYSYGYRLRQGSPEDTVARPVWRSPRGTYASNLQFANWNRPAYALDYTNRDEMVRLFRCMLRASHVDPATIETWATPVHATLGALAFVEGDDPTAPPPEPLSLSVRVLDREEEEWARRHGGNGGTWVCLTDRTQRPRDWRWLHHRRGPLEIVLPEELPEGLPERAPSFD